MIATKMSVSGPFTPQADTIRVEDTSPNTLKEIKLNWLTRPSHAFSWWPAHAQSASSSISSWTLMSEARGLSIPTSSPTN